MGFIEDADTINAMATPKFAPLEFKAFATGTPLAEHNGRAPPISDANTMDFLLLLNL